MKWTSFIMKFILKLEFFQCIFLDVHISIFLSQVLSWILAKQNINVIPNWKILAKHKNIAHFFNTGFSPIFDDGNKILGTWETV